MYLKPGVYDAGNGRKLEIKDGPGRTGTIVLDGKEYTVTDAGTPVRENTPGSAPPKPKPDEKTGPAYAKVPQPPTI